MINLWKWPLLHCLLVCQPKVNHFCKVTLLILLFVVMSGCQSEQNNADSTSNNFRSVIPNSDSNLARDRGQDDRLFLATGNTLSMQDLKDSVLLVNFWAIWCAPCRIEIPELNFLYTHRQVNVLGIDFDQRAREELQSAIAEMGIQFPVLSAKSAAELNIDWPEALPVTLVVINFEVAEILHGAQTSESIGKAISRAQNRVKAKGSG